MDCSTPGLPVHHQLPELTQTHIHRVDDAIQPSHLPSSPSPPTFNLAQHQSLFQWGSSLYQVAKVLELQLQHQSFQWIFVLISFRMDWLDLLAVPGTLKSLLQCLVRIDLLVQTQPCIFSNTTAQNHNSLAFSFLYGPALTSIYDYWKNHSFD